MEARREHSFGFKVWVAFLFVLGLASLCNYLTDVQAAHAYQPPQTGIVLGHTRDQKPARLFVVHLVRGESGDGEKQGGGKPYGVAQARPFAGCAALKPAHNAVALSDSTGIRVP